ncbi:hypothetical protein DXX99_02605 [Ammonifex thiophilus]|uniref:DUF4367 domain-containing protein n=2 Tax=Ammonifex thiophilus TaxID=444093 RepID=A0A3D8P6J4_9THEO|nr:hypothetical protein DXX99_02605 [Ammonifex thiophilus]
MDQNPFDPLEERLRRLLRREAEEVRLGRERAAEIVVAALQRRRRARWKKGLVAAAAAFVLLFGALLSIFPQFRAWAEMHIMHPMLAFTYRYVRVEDSGIGYLVMEKRGEWGKASERVESTDTLLHDLESGGGKILKKERWLETPTPDNLAQAEAQLGFPVRSPTRLPPGWSLLALDWARNEISGRGHAMLTFGPRSGDPQLRLFITNYSPLAGEQRPEGEEVQKTEVNGKVAYLVRVPRSRVGADGKVVPVPPMNVLEWEFGGVFFTLIDLEGAFSPEELREIAASVK